MPRSSSLVAVDKTGMRYRSLRMLLPAALTLMLLPAAGMTPAVLAQANQTLCILDFHRLGDDARADWLQQGLTDMMITTMNSLSPYLVIERRYLKEILREHGLAGSGLISMDTAVRRAQLAKAQILLLGSFARLGDQLTIQVRLIRVSDQRVLSQTTWTDSYSKVLSAPRALSQKLLVSLGNPPDPGRLEGIEKQIPTTIDVAKSYYLGVRAFDDGHYPEALAHYLDAARQAADFPKVNPAVLEMYYLLGRSEHAVLFARELAQSYEKGGDVPSALEYYFAAAKESLDPLNNQRTGSDLLQKLLRLVEQHEHKTGEIAKTKRSILARIDELSRSEKDKDFDQLLGDRAIRYQMWSRDIESELARRAEEQARGGHTVLADGKWIKQPVPKPSALMWRIRARHMLARAYARLGEIRPALDQYRGLIEEYEFLTRHPLYNGRLLTSITTESHFMWLRSYAATGRLILDHDMNRINRLNHVKNGLIFTRDFRDARPDARARVASRDKGRGHEYYDFAAPPGHQIDSLTLRINVEGIAELGFNLLQPAGWPPQFSFSKRFENFKFSKRGAYNRRVVPPPGTEFLSVGTGWGPGLFSNTQAEVEHWKLRGPKDGPDIVHWQVEFAVSPKRGVAETKSPGVKPTPDPAVQKLIDRYAAGWQRGYVVRDAQTVAYSGSPRLDVYAEDWLVYSMNGDIRIVHQRDPRLKISLPITINSRESEFDPSLVRTHEGRYALLWARGTSARNASRFLAFSADLLKWETPQRMVFEDVPPNTRYTYSQVEPLERTYNIAPVRRGYVMLLAQGFLRHSEDLRNWGAPLKVIPQDLLRNRVIKSRDGILWALYENSSPELQPYTPDDWLHGFFVIDGKQYRHVTEVGVSRSADGIDWKAAGKVILPGQPSGLWTFAVDERQIGIALGFNNLFVKWFSVSSLGDLRQIDSQIQLMHQSGEAEFFVLNDSVTCLRPVFDFEDQKPMLLATSTEHFLVGARKK